MSYILHSIICCVELLLLQICVIDVHHTRCMYYLILILPHSSLTGRTNAKLVDACFLIPVRLDTNNFWLTLQCNKLQSGLSRIPYLVIMITPSNYANTWSQIRNCVSLEHLIKTQYLLNEAEQSYQYCLKSKPPSCLNSPGLNDSIINLFQNN